MKKVLTIVLCVACSFIMGAQTFDDIYSNATATKTKKTSQSSATENFSLQMLKYRTEINRVLLDDVTRENSFSYTLNDTLKGFPSTSPLITFAIKDKKFVIIHNDLMFYLPLAEDGTITPSMWFFLEIAKKSIEWSEVCADNGITDLSKEMTIQFNAEVEKYANELKYYFIYRIIKQNGKTKIMCGVNILDKNYRGRLFLHNSELLGICKLLEKKNSEGFSLGSVENERKKYNEVYERLK